MVSGVKLTEEQAIKRVWDKCNLLGLEFHGFSGGSWEGAKTTKLKLYCDKHRLVWKTTLYSGFVGKSNKGCLQCGVERRSSKALIKEDTYLKRFEEVQGYKYIYCLEKGLKAKDKMVIKCLKCSNIFKQTPDNHLQGKGCVSCKSSGYDKNKPANIYCVLWGLGNHYFVKVGVTNNDTVDRIRIQSNKTPYNPYVVKTYHHKSGEFVADLEKEIKHKFPSGVVNKDKFPDGYTETFNLSDYKGILTFIKTRMEQ
ncbi:MAG: hypothetical protein GY861_10980 [bacterium]|nr:hypothetical protein [bacterium]